MDKGTLAVDVLFSQMGGHLIKARQLLKQLPDETSKQIIAEINAAALNGQALRRLVIAVANSGDKDQATEESEIVIEKGK